MTEDALKDGTVRSQADAKRLELTASLDAAKVGEGRQPEDVMSTLGYMALIITTLDLAS